MKIFRIPQISVSMRSCVIASLAVICLAGCATLNSSEQKDRDPKSADNQTQQPHALTGAELYSMHCNRCHPERYPTERTAAQWKTILLHMRVRANPPAQQARMILSYLQDNSGR